MHATCNQKISHKKTPLLNVRDIDDMRQNKCNQYKVIVSQAFSGKTSKVSCSR